MTATSSAVVARTWPSTPPGPTAAAPPEPVPNAPKITFVMVRFIALPIIWVSSVPEAPTSVPEMISTLFESAKPVEAVARPVNAFRSEITTGMSAPPIAITIWMPSTNASAIVTTSSVWLSWPVPRITLKASTAATSAPVTIRWPGTTTGDPEIISCSLPKAIIDPEKLIEPAEAVEERHHLRHRGHLHLAGADRPADAADDRPERDPLVRQHPLVEQRGHDGEGHADGGELVAGAGGGRGGEPP